MDAMANVLRKVAELDAKICEAITGYRELAADLLDRAAALEAMRSGVPADLDVPPAEVATFPEAEDRAERPWIPAPPAPWPRQPGQMDAPPTARPFSQCQDVTAACAAVLSTLAAEPPPADEPPPDLPDNDPDIGQDDRPLPPDPEATAAGLGVTAPATDDPVPLDLDDIEATPRRICFNREPHAPCPLCKFEAPALSPADREAWERDHADVDALPDAVQPSEAVKVGPPKRSSPAYTDCLSWRCRACGCGEEQCTGGCGWAEVGPGEDPLCTRCAAEADLPPGKCRRVVTEYLPGPDLSGVRAASVEWPPPEGAMAVTDPVALSDLRVGDVVQSSLLDGTWMQVTDLGTGDDRVPHARTVRSKSWRLYHGEYGRVVRWIPAGGDVTPSAEAQRRAGSGVDCVDCPEGKECSTCDVWARMQGKAAPQPGPVPGPDPKPICTACGLSPADDEDGLCKTCRRGRAEAVSVRGKVARKRELPPQVDLTIRASLIQAVETAKDLPVAAITVFQRAAVLRSASLDVQRAELTKIVAAGLIQRVDRGFYAPKGWAPKCG